MRPFAPHAIAALAFLSAPMASAQNAGELLWRYEIEHGFLENSPTVAPDGTLYACDTTGRLYAINPDGTERWTADALHGQPGNGDEGPVAVFADGTVLVPVNPLGNPIELVAFNPDGTLKWTRTFSDAISWFAGPSIGPDGLAYAAASGPDSDDQVLAIDSAGSVAWSTRAEPNLYEENPIGSHIAFARDGARDVLAFHCDQNGRGGLFGFGTNGTQDFEVFVSSVNAPFMQHLQLQVASDYLAGRFYMTAFGMGSAWGMTAFEADGSVAWRYDPYIASEATAPAVGPDGAVFLAWDLHYLGAVEPNGSERWQIFDDVPFREPPAVHPSGDFIVLVGSSFGQSGRIEAFDAHSGNSIWTTPFTLPVAGTVYPSGQPVFSNDGAAVYAGSSVFSSADVGSYIYAFAATDIAPCFADCDASGTLNIDDIDCFVNAFVSGDLGSADCDSSGTLNVDDIDCFVASFVAGCG